MKHALGLVAAAFLLHSAVPALRAQSTNQPVKAASPAANASPVTHVNAAQAAKLIKEGKVTVLDERTPGEYQGGHIAGARLMDCTRSDFAEQVAKLDRQKTYLIHCAAGGRSTRSLKDFARLGFTNVVHLDGGFNAWKAAGHPAVQGK